MFIHWGLYSLLGRGEWVMFQERMRPSDYRKLADRFRPTKFDADAWAGLAAEAGMKYMVLTTRHHNGFCLFDSSFSDFTSAKCAARRDFVAEYVAACRRAGIKVGLYYSLLDGVRGQGQYVGTFMTRQQNNGGWWGEGEIKMYLDGDTEFPTICGTGTEDYFGGAWCFGDNQYSAPYLGFQTVAGKNMQVRARMTLYRFHIAATVFFQKDLRVTMQALGWRKEGRYQLLRDDIASVAYWYQTLPHAPFPPLPNRNAREII